MKALAPLWLIALTGLCSCTGAGPVSPPPAPAIIGVALCPEPVVPVLPVLNGGSSFDAPAAWAALMERDDALRAYIAALRRTVRCYAAQAGE